MMERNFLSYKNKKHQSSCSGVFFALILDSMTSSGIEPEFTP